MDNVAKNIALGAAAVSAGAVVVGAAILGNNLTPLSTSNNDNVRMSGGGGAIVSVQVAEVNPEVELTAPNDGDTFLSPNLNMTTSFKDTLNVGYTLTAPNGNTCELPTGSATSGAWDSPEGAIHNGTINLAACQGGAYGEYTLKTYSAGFSTSDSRYAEDSRSFYYSRFSVLYSTFDNNSDPIIIIRYGDGIGLVELSARRVGESTDVLDSWNYVVEHNEDNADEVVLPFKDKGAKVGNYVLTAKAYKKDGSPLNTQDTTGATVTANFDYNGVSESNN